MDIFIEQLVIKKKTAASYAIIFACLVGAFAVLFLFTGFLFPLLAMVPGMGGLAVLICFGLIWFLYRIITNTNAEYEYCFTNGALDVDKILNRRKRKRIADLNARTIEKMASAKDPEFARLMQDSAIKKVYACSHKDAEDLYYILYEGAKGRRVLLFNPNEKIKDGFRRFNPKKVFLDA